MIAMENAMNVPAMRGEIELTTSTGELEMNAVTTTHTSSEILPASTTSRTAMAPALLSHANRVNGVVPGRRLKFVKGKWYIGDELADPNDDYYADPFTITTRYELWQNGQIIDVVIAT